MRRIILCLALFAPAAGPVACGDSNTDDGTEQSGPNGGRNTGKDEMLTYDCIMRYDIEPLLVFADSPEIAVDDISTRASIRGARLSGILPTLI